MYSNWIGWFALILNVITIYADGGCRGNQNETNIGGWGAVLQYKGYQKELFEGVKNTTNNQMELTACIKALEAINTTDIPIEIYADSAYVVNGMNSWVAGWKKKGWRKGDGKKPENLDLWKRLDQLVLMQDSCKFLKVRGHSGDTYNELADQLANQAMDELVA
ncbi:ribonuclease HI [Priestia megaterium]|uniref:ribonuclease HI n=1 Tax=Priestia megaterium TaxID=1404 RepID=UPI00211D898A|nr:ribonuclease HI [Priestia megaterium]